MSFLSLHHVLIQLLHEYGNIVLGVVVGLECVGLPLPGETLLIAAAVIAGRYRCLGDAERTTRWAVQANVKVVVMLIPRPDFV